MKELQKHEIIPIKKPHKPKYNFLNNVNIGPNNTRRNMSIINKKLRTLNVEPDTMVSLTYSEGTDCFMHTEDQVETAMAETSVIPRFAELVTTPGLDVQTRWGDNVIEEIRVQGFLHDYPRDHTFTEFVDEVIRDNYYDLDLIEHSTEAYDYKRGFCTLTAAVTVQAESLINNSLVNLSGWQISIATPAGTLTFDN